MQCPIHQIAIKSPNATAIYSENIEISYQELDKQILTLQNLLPLPSSDYLRVSLEANLTLATLVTFFAYLRLHIPVILLSPKEPNNIDKSKDISALYLNGLNIENFYQEAICTKKIQFQDDKTNPSLNKEPLIGIYTSGTTACPKLAMFSLDNFICSAKGLSKAIPIEKGDVWGLSLPFYHTAGLSILFKSFCHEIAVDFSPYHKRVTHISLVPTLAIRNFEKLPQYKVVLLGGAPVDKKQFSSLNNTYISYGMSEMSSTICIDGVILDGREAKLSNTSEILVKGDMLFKGYLENETLSLPLDKDGYFSTKDIGKFDNGLLSIEKRANRMFISGGENINPEEIEMCLLAIDGILSARVQGTKDFEFGTRPQAFITIKKENSLDNKKLQIHDEHSIKMKLAERLPKFKVPDRIFIES